jgi:hypothetical protein
MIKFYSEGTWILISLELRLKVKDFIEEIGIFLCSYFLLEYPNLAVLKL